MLPTVLPASLRLARLGPLLTAALFGLPVATHASALAHGIFTPDGAWCWFSDPRAVCRDGQIVAGWMTADGSVQVGSRPLGGGDLTVATLAPEFERDDHDHPAFAILPDGRIAAFFSRHAKGDMLLAHSVPGDLAAWTSPRELGFVDPARGPRGITYANPFLLTAEENTLWCFWRGSDFKPTFATSRDGGATWSPQRTLISERGRDTGNRPYVKYWSDGRGRIDLIFTDGHPRNEPGNSVYYARYEKGAFWRADGTLIATMEDLPLQPAECDKLYDGRTGGRAWVWSVAADSAGRPVVGYTRLPAETDHRYHFARWDGSRWIDHEITPAGAWFPRTPAGTREREPHYSGGMAIDPANPARVYLSRPVNGVFEIEEWNTPDGGATWSHAAVTRDSAADNVRPFVVPGTPADRTVVLWMHNLNYEHYTRYRTQLHYAVCASARR